jgi:hypothetical protein
MVVGGTLAGRLGFPLHDFHAVGLGKIDDDDSDG